MGSHYSGRWRGHKKLIQVESCFALDAGRVFWRFKELGFRTGCLELLPPTSLGPQPRSVQVDYRMLGEPGKVPELIILTNTGWGLPANGIGKQQVARLSTSATNFSGRRWWFHCPMIVKGEEKCGRRVGYLFLPPGGTLLGCRECHGLTYRLSQTHRTPLGNALRNSESLMAMIERDPTRAFLLSSEIEMILEATIMRRTMEGKGSRRRGPGGRSSPAGAQAQ